MVFDTILLRSLQVVAQEASFTKAACRLNLTQSAVSAHIRRLEEQAGKALLTRSTRSVALTPEGEDLLGYARAILCLNEAAWRKLSGVADGVHIRIGASDDFMSASVPVLLQRVQSSRPALTLDVRVANTGLLLAATEAGELDLVLGSRCHGEQRGQLLWREALVWA